MQLRRWLWTVAERTDRELPTTVFADEIHDIAPQSQKDELAGRDAVRKIGKEGEKRNIKLYGISQDPVAFDKQSLRQRSYLVVFALAHEQASYLSEYGVEVGVVNDQPEYAGVVYHADGREIDRGVKAAERYA